MASKDAVENKNARDHVTEEVADLWFHCMVLLVHLGIGPEDILEVLENRFGEEAWSKKQKEPLRSSTMMIGLQVRPIQRAILRATYII